MLTRRAEPDSDALSTLLDLQVPRVANFGKKPAVPTPFCTTSVCSTARVAPRNVVNVHSAFVSDDDKVLLKSLAYGGILSRSVPAAFLVPWLSSCGEHPLSWPGVQGTRAPLAPSSLASMSATSTRSGACRGDLCLPNSSGKRKCASCSLR